MKTFIDKPYEVQLDLETAAGNFIENIQHTEEVSQSLTTGLQKDYNKQFPNKLVPRTKNGNNIYNCHGLVFASRRTRIWDSATVRKILYDDKYEKVENTNDVKPGDIALYIINGAIDHSAVVIEVQLSELIKVPRIKVFSKWGGWIEIIHDVRDCEWGKEPECQMEYYRVER